jgi:hypothetical protein
MLTGAQFNQNLFAQEPVNARGQKIPGTRVPVESLADLEHRLKVIKPQFVRVFFSPYQDKDRPSTRDSFMRTVQLAQATGATINITVQSVSDAEGQDAGVRSCPRRARAFPGVHERARGHASERAEHARFHADQLAAAEPAVPVARYRVGRSSFPDQVHGRRSHSG